jgi:hypothetical protein
LSGFWDLGGLTGFVGVVVVVVEGLWGEAEDADVDEFSCDRLVESELVEDDDDILTR